ncbi:MAG: hypothetical protein K2H01_03230 [Ruminococcus sp.]|nr:hypothetical protein [Ruminococcus sp.]
MTEYINCENAYDYQTLEDWYINSIDNNISSVWTGEHIEELLNDFYVVPKDVPTIEAEPVRHGKWSNKMVAYRAESDIEEHGDMHFGFRCSECNAILNNKTKYCGNCGAKMDLEELE